MALNVLHEVSNIAQPDKHLIKRWFTSQSADLFVWYDGDRFSNFEFCYDKHINEHSLRWNTEYGFCHFRIDDGEGDALSYKKSPMHVKAGDVNINHVFKEFDELSVDIEPAIREFILKQFLVIT